MSILTDCIRADGEYSQLLSVIQRNFKDKKSLPAAAGGLCEGAADTLCVSLAEDTEKERRRPALIVCADEKECLKLRQIFEQFGRSAEFYIARDLTFHNITASHEYEHERLRVLSGILEGSVDTVISTPDALLGYTMPPEKLLENTVEIDLSTRIEPSELAKKLTDAGYARVDMVEGAGQFSVRGGIVDVYSPYGVFTDTSGAVHTRNAAVRMEFFGDEIDRMGIFDVETQRLTVNIDSAKLIPAREVIADKEARERIEKAIRSQFRTASDEKVCETLTGELTSLRNSLSEINFIDKYIALVYPERATLLDYFDSKTLVILRSSAEVLKRLRAGELLSQQTVREICESGTVSPKHAEYSRESAFFELFCDRNVTLYVDSLAYGVTDRRLSGLFGFRSRQPVSYADNFNLLCEDILGYQRGGYRIVVMAENETAANNLCEMLADADFNAVAESSRNEYALSDIPQNTVFVEWKRIIFGYELMAPRVAVLSTATDARAGSLNPSSRAKKRAKKKRAGEVILSYNELEAGDVVVHETYGIGRFLGIEKLTIDGVSRDYISIQYAGSDKLCMPVEKLDLVSKYIGARSDDGAVKLSKMGGESWKKATAKAKGAVREMAKDLIKLYAERMRRKGYAFSSDGEMQRNFEDAFGYEETQCQLDAIEDIKQDMMQNAPMDRLLCGDVGYGKTEVAFRAAYKAILDGKQVAMLVPTTILALQHYQTAISRMRSFAVNVDMISRFRTPKQQETTLRRLARGDVDLIVGTHRLLGKDVEFKDLGLLIIDEEQRFGVAQKEKLKQLAGNIDVLTLTATPIPRTLNMAMGGIRDMSILDEAPGDRLPVQTYVLGYDELIISEAIRKELRRGGQIFYLHNFVETINETAARISRLVPEARVTVAHGKMEKDEIEDIWADMIAGNIDVLVSTTIIETGVDVPNANTLIVENAHRLGLSQLHQLRGRVGRSSRRAYAYFTYPRDRSVTEIAQKRLEAIREYAEFGSGFRIALRDMEIRGAGNILGAEQHGHLEAIGYDMYIKLLNDAVLEEKGEKPKEKTECVVSIDFDAYIPETYVKYPAQRMALYKRIALIRDQYDADDIADELLDRFGDMPNSVDNLLRIALVRSYASELGITKIIQQKGEIRLYTEGFDMDMWSDMSDISDGRLRAVMGSMGDNYVSLRLRSGENGLSTVNKLFEKYISSIRPKG